MRRGEANIQRALTALGFNAGRADGRFGRKTLAAIRAFQASIGASQTGALTVAQQAQLLKRYTQGGTPQNTQGVTPQNRQSGIRQIDPTIKQSADNFLTSINNQGVNTRNGLTLPGQTDKAANNRASGDTDTDQTNSLAKYCSETEARHQTVLKPDQNTPGDEIIAQQFCIVRSHVLAQASQLMTAEQRATAQKLLGDCRGGLKKFERVISRIGEKTPLQTTADLQAVYKADQRYKAAMVDSSKVCAGLGLGLDDYNVSLGYAVLLIRLNQFQYGELVAGHIVYGIGTPQDYRRAGEWYRWAAEALAKGTRPIVNPQGVDRIAILKFIANDLENSTDVRSQGRIVRKPAPTKRVFKSMIPREPGRKASAASKKLSAASSKIALERYRSHKLLPAAFELLGIDSEQFTSACNEQEKELQSIEWSEQTAKGAPNIVWLKLCRALSYANKDHRRMEMYDKVLARVGFTPAKQAMVFHQQFKSLYSPNGD